MCKYLFSNALGNIVAFSLNKSENRFIGLVIWREAVNNLMYNERGHSEMHS